MLKSMKSEILNSKLIVLDKDVTRSTNERLETLIPFLKICQEQDAQIGRNFKRDQNVKFLSLLETYGIHGILDTRDTTKEIEQKKRRRFRPINH